ncbi:molybdopterin-dependent oxidoreductase [uncultured Senegalimassilia sp.]|uniref:molybdopterin-containing oxidoreductase family protein n=1 Tax=uncultured Senegalimassilia sp. TaxID=1714350 RepID=UPI002671C0A8|nr:molybdopterin-dependent oxidoreductase [uncultured Senegalimassilia sp.]
MGQATMTRRSFAKVSALVASGAALGATIDVGNLVAAEAKVTSSGTRKVKTLCRACVARCAVIATVENGRVVKLEGNTEDGTTHGGLCAKGLSGIQALYNPNRNKYPMRRVGERGGNEWERITWEQAIDEIAQKLWESKKQYGPESIFMSTGGGGNPQFWSVNRFAAAIQSPNTFEPGCAQCYLPRMVSYKLMYGGDFMTGNCSMADSNCFEMYNPEVDIDAVVIWAAQPAADTPPGGGRVMADRRAAGCKTVVVDPRFTVDAARADVWLPIRAGSDVAMQLCWVKYMIEKRGYDADFCLKWTNLPYLVDPKTGIPVRAVDLGLVSKEENDAQMAATATDTLTGHATAKNNDNPALGYCGIPYFVIWDKKTGGPVAVPYPKSEEELNRFFDEETEAELFNDEGYTIDGVSGYKTAFQLTYERSREWTLEKTAEVTWCDAADIEAAIDIFCEAKTAGIVGGVATDQNPQSGQASAGYALLSLLNGDVEKPGALLQRFPKPAMADELGGMYGLVSADMERNRLGFSEHRGIGQWAMSVIPYVWDAIETGKPYKPRIWLERSGNKLQNLAETERCYNLLPQLDLIVHMYMYPTSFTIEAADYVLPILEWLESNQPIQILNKVFARQECTHLFETRNEAMIWSDLTKRMMELGDEDCREAIYDTKGMVAAAGGIPMPLTDTDERNAHVAGLGMTWDEFCDKAPYEFCSWEDWHTYYYYKQTDACGYLTGFDTASGKCEPYSEGYITLGLSASPWAMHPEVFVDNPVENPNAANSLVKYGYDPLPYYEEPEESPLTDTEYPLVMSNGRLPMYHHGTLRNVPYLREIYPVPEVWVYPDDAEKYGVKDGQWAWIRSRRAEIRGKVRVTKGVRPGEVYMERFWLPEFLDQEGKRDQSWRSVTVNRLSKSTGRLSDVNGTYTLRAYQVAIAPAESGPEGAWTEPEDFEPWMPQYSEPTEVIQTCVTL